MAGAARTARRRDDAPDAYRSTRASPRTPYGDSQSHLNQEAGHTFGNEDSYAPTWHFNQNTYTIQNADANQDSNSDKDQDTNADQNPLAHAYSIEKTAPSH